MPSRMCPTCGKPYRGSVCPRCRKDASGSQRKHGTRSKEAEKVRKDANPWRSEYGRAEYRKARQIAIQRTNGRCAVTGTKCAVYRDGEWKVLPNGGVHHIVPLSQGGGNDPDNLVLLCTAAHNKIDAARRQQGR